MLIAVRTTLLGTLAAVLCTGCNQSSPIASPAVSQSAPASGVAVIDLDVIAKQLGSDKQMAQAMQHRQAKLNEQLTGLAKAYVGQLEAQRKKLEQEEAAGVQLAQYQQQANQNLGVAKRQAQQDLTQHRGRLVKQFRDAVRPAARAIASERGYTMIVTRQDSLLFDYLPDADITQAVIERLRAQSSQGRSKSASDSNSSQATTAGDG